MELDLSLVRLVLGASVVVQLVMLLLLVTSVVSWALIFRKRGVLAHARRDSADFESRFWSGTDLVSMYNSINSAGSDPGEWGASFAPVPRIRPPPAHRDRPAGCDLRLRTRDAGRDAPRGRRPGEPPVVFLATVGSTSPYIGLFGTVWGIMNSFRALGNVGQATLAMVAPGIAEALIATAMGLFAAIPAVIAYNRYLSDVESLSNRFSTFVEEFSTILQRQRVD